MPMPASAGVHATTVTDRSELAPGIILLGLHAPHLASVTLPGQFLLAIPPRGELAATALGIYEAQDERVSLMLVICGPRTRELSELQPGASLDVLAPLGNGFDLETELNDVAIVAGGVGIASVLLAARALRRRNVRVRLYYGARTKAALVDADRFEREGCELRLATDDGSAGFAGFVTELLASDGDPPQMILACGPTPMLRAVQRFAKATGIRAQLSLEETFACGVGACWG
ncbi:MAG: dihydroorotate dehydrogenase electron transfer subunit, partial [Candidatus Eremiobacteraeota bacterium]|nr:dihydroorotate dehydrogenase electron transfer subunit [Candidatus Eremiobacteraeota bacterium]